MIRLNAALVIYWLIYPGIHLSYVFVKARRGWRVPKKSVVRFVGVVCAACLASLTACRSVPAPVETAEPPSSDNVWSAYRAEPMRPAVSPPPSRSGPRYAEVRVDGPYIALTFDDGPNARLTPQLLDILKEQGVRATFFVVGRQVAAQPEILRRIAADGHEIGNHTWDHSSLDKIGTDAVRSQMEKTNNVIRAVVGQEPTLMRPPYGKSNPSLNQWIFDNFGLKVILWSVDSNDWRHRDAGLVQREILKGAKSGAIILAHDTQPSTVAAMPATLASLRAEGFRFVTVSELIALEQE